MDARVEVLLDLKRQLVAPVPLDCREAVARINTVMGANWKWRTPRDGTLHLGYWEWRASWEVDDRDVYEARHLLRPDLLEAAKAPQAMKRISRVSVVWQIIHHHLKGMGYEQR